jgi:hypothetical protein
MSSRKKTWNVGLHGTEVMLPPLQQLNDPRVDELDLLLHLVFVEQLTVVLAVPLKDGRKESRCDEEGRKEGYEKEEG